ncbi:MAG TPA: response regulator transcription factor [Flavobacteriales bacterium]|jgi:DNA-binding response OmpR family regulator|nr:response regulator transcription factor [Flavobacteriales bacterium]
MESPIKLLLCEDDPNLGSLLAQYLTAKGYEVELRVNGKLGWDAYIKGGFDLLILDVMMPVKDGFTLAREVRGRDERTPIIFLTAKSMKQDTIQGFQSGADDYLTKPFSMEELLLRVSAVLKRARGIAPKEKAQTEHQLGGFTFDVRKQLLRGEGQERKLTTKETELLRLLCEHRQGILQRADALREVWGDDSYFNGRSMDVYIAKLRKYLKDDPRVEILNVHGKGFRLVTKEE